MQFTRSLKAPGFNPWSLKCVISWFFTFCFFTFNLCRYIEDGEQHPRVRSHHAAVGPVLAEAAAGLGRRAGALQGEQVLSLSAHDLRGWTRGGERSASAAGAGRARGGAVQVEMQLTHSA